jgi:hypothetical protein
MRLAQSLQLRVHFELNNRYDCEDLRVEIMDIIRITSHMPGKQVTFRITWGPTIGNGALVFDFDGEVVISLEELRQRALLALTHVCWDHPSVFTRARPQLWMDKDGVNVEAKHPASSTTYVITQNPQDQPTGGPSNYFLSDYRRKYNFHSDPWDYLGLVEWDPVERRWREEDQDLHRWPRLTMESDGCLLSYIKYLNSVLSDANEADMWARVCELYASP